MATVVVEDAAAEGGVGGRLVGPGDRREDAQAARIDVLGEAVGSHLARHLGDVLGMYRVIVGFTLDDQCLLQGGFVLLFVERPISFMRRNTYCWRSLARFGLTTGLNAEGAFGSPASIAASAAVKSFSGLPK